MYFWGTFKNLNFDDSDDFYILIKIYLNFYNFHRLTWNIMMCNHVKTWNSFFKKHISIQYMDCLYVREMCVKSAIMSHQKFRFLIILQCDQWNQKFCELKTSWSLKMCMHTSISELVRSYQKSRRCNLQHFDVNQVLKILTDGIKW